LQYLLYDFTSLFFLQIHVALYLIKITFLLQQHLFSYGVFTGAKTSCHSLDITEITNDNYPINSRGTKAFIFI